MKIVLVCILCEYFRENKWFWVEYTTLLLESSAFCGEKKVEGVFIRERIFRPLKARTVYVCPSHDKAVTDILIILR